jgi:RNA polymerase sigma-70 factor (ECF subfamily)
MIENTTILSENESELIRFCIAGDRRSQKQLYDLHASKMFAVCLRYSKNREEAEDILQEGFVQVFKSLKNFRFEGCFEGWVRRIMVYSYVKHYRSNSKLHAIIKLDSFDRSESENEDAVSMLSKKELLNMVQNLPNCYRIVFNLYVFEGFKHREIAEQLGISEGTSKSNFYDAKVILRRAVANSLNIAKQNY